MDVNQNESRQASGIWGSATSKMAIEYPLLALRVIACVGAHRRFIIFHQPQLCIPATKNSPWNYYSTFLFFSPFFFLFYCFFIFFFFFYFFLCVFLFLLSESIPSLLLFGWFINNLFVAERREEEEEDEQPDCLYSFPFVTHRQSSY